MSRTRSAECELNGAHWSQWPVVGAVVTFPNGSRAESGWTPETAPMRRADTTQWGEPMSLIEHVPVPERDRNEGYQLLKVLLMVFALLQQPPGSELGVTIQLLFIALEARPLFMRPAI